MHSRSTAGREQCAMQHMAFNKSANWVQPHQPASFAILIERKARRTYPYFPNIRVQHPCALSDYNNGATLIRTEAVHTHLFFGYCQTGISENYLRVSIAGFACSLCCMQGTFLARRRTVRIDLKNTQKPPRGWNSGLRRSTVIIIMGSACRPSFKPPAATFLAASTHRICKLARPMETPLCRMCFYSHTCNGFMTVA